MVNRGVLTHIGSKSEENAKFPKKNRKSGNRKLAQYRVTSEHAVTRAADSKSQA